jgi:hypothetical protein
MTQGIEFERVVPENGVEPLRRKARDFKSVEALAATGKRLNYKASRGINGGYFGPQQGTKAGTAKTAVWGAA